MNDAAIKRGLTLAGIDPQARMVEYWAELPDGVAEQWLRWAKISPEFPVQPWTQLSDAERGAVLEVMRKVCDIYRASNFGQRWHIVAGVL